MSLRRASVSAFIGLASLVTSTSHAAPKAPNAKPLALHAAPPLGVKARVVLDKAFYDVGDTMKARVTFASDPGDARLGVLVVARTGDVELIAVKRVGAGVYETEVSNARLVRTGGVAPKPHDGKLEVKDGETVQAILVSSGKAKIEAGADFVGDTAIVGTNAAGLPKITIAQKGMTAKEAAAAKSARPFGLLVARGSAPIEIAHRELVFVPHGPYTIQALLDYTGGKVKADIPPPPAQNVPGAPTYLVELPAGRGRVDRLADMRAVFSEKGDIIAAQPATLAAYAAVLELRMRGFHVSANTKLASHSISSTEMAGTSLTNAMQMTNASGAACPAGDPSTCPINVPALWAHMALWDLDAKTIPVAFIDEGFATANPDFRHPAGGAPFVECDFESVPERCASGAANTPPTVGASFVGARVWHATGSISVAGGILNNNWIPGVGGTVTRDDGSTTPAPRGGVAGTGGQVLVPMMYRFGMASYAFDIGRGIRRAVDDGAAAINIPAGYPCNIPLSVVGDFEVCNPAARSAACAGLVGTLEGAAATACAAMTAVGGIPIVGAILLPGLVAACTAATASATAVAPACVALDALGDTRGPMEDGVRYATAHGVPIIASMGNNIGQGLPAEIQSFVDLSHADGNSLHMIPATIPGVIAIGAARVSGGTWANSELGGASIAVWAPEDSNYLSPPVGSTTVPTGAAGFTLLSTHAGTSATSSYVTGIVAAMQAASSQLDRRTPGLLNVAGIPARIRSILTSTSTTMGSGSSAIMMVNPFKAVLTAWGGPIPRFDQNLDFDDDGSDDRVEGARAVSGTMKGTLVTILGSADGAPPVVDKDFYKMTLNGAGASLFVPVVTLTFPSSFRSSNGQLVVAEPSGVRFRETGRVPIGTDGTVAVTFTGPPSAAGSTQAFQVIGNTPFDDNVYELTASAFASIGPDRFDVAGPSNFAVSSPNNNDPRHAVPIGVGLASNAGLSWTGPTRNGMADVYSVLVNGLNFHVPDDQDWFVIQALPQPRGTACGELVIALPPEVMLQTADIGGGNLRAIPATPGVSPRAAVLRVNANNPFMLRYTAMSGHGGGTYALDLRYTPIAICR